MDRTNVAIIGQLALVHFVAKFAMKWVLSARQDDDGVDAFADDGA